MWSGPLSGSRSCKAASFCLPPTKLRDRLNCRSRQLLTQLLHPLEVFEVKPVPVFKFGENGLCLRVLDLDGFMKGIERSLPDDLIVILARSHSRRNLDRSEERRVGKECRSR